jgi:hypothetical protein
MMAQRVSGDPSIRDQPTSGHRVIQPQRIDEDEFVRRLVVVDGDPQVETVTSFPF